MPDGHERFGKGIPLLASLDMPRTLQFYKNVLGFRISQFEEYGTAARGDVELHFWACSDRNIAENTSCYIRVDDIYALHAELKDKLPDLEEVQIRPWGMAELYVIDLDGNLLRFGQSTDKAT